MKFISVSKYSNNDYYLDRKLTDFLKIISCILVASSHYGQMMILNGRDVNGIIRIIASHGGYLGVAIFFFLSGFGLVCSLNKSFIPFSQFIKKRVSKVYIPAVFYSLLWVLLLWQFPEYQKEDLGGISPVTTNNIIKSLISVFFLQFYDSVLWFVKVILALYPITYLYKLISKRNIIISIFYLLAACILATFIVYKFVALFASVSIGLFFAGILVADYKEQLMNKKLSVFICSTIAIILSVILFKNNSFIIHGIINYAILTIIIFITCLFRIQLFPGTSSLTEASYDLYLIHKKILVLLFIYNIDVSILSFLLVTIILSLTACHLRKYIIL